MQQRAVAIAGIGTTEYSKNSGRSEMRLAMEAILAALRDAGIDPSHVDGLVSFTMDNNEDQAVSRNLGVDHLSFFAQTPAGGGGGPATLGLAAMAIQTGKARTVVCYRAMNERSQQRFGAPDGYIGLGAQNSTMIDRSWASPYGLVTPASRMAMSIRRYMHEYGATSEDFGRLAVAQRAYAVNNPEAMFFGRPLSLDEHQASKIIADPMRLFDCCQETDGAVAIVLTSRERAKDLRQKPITVVDVAQGMGPQQFGMASVYRDDIALAIETKIAGSQLWQRTGLTPADIDVASIYDHFGPAVLLQLEALGFCGRGEAPDLIREGGILRDGAIPTNTNGGQLSEAYLHGFNGMVEAVRQLRGTAINQVPGAEHAIVTGGSHVATSAAIFGAGE